MLKRSALALAMICALALAGCGGAPKEASSTPAADQGDRITIATLAQIDAYPAWRIADADHNYLLKTYDAGIPMVEDLATKAWQIGDAGAVPAMLGVMNRNVAIVGIASDESAANAILAKKGSPLLKEKDGDIYGSADLLRGKAIYTSTVSSAHYALAGYLRHFGLSEQDVNIQSASQADCLEALKSGKADLVVLWAPTTYEALADGAEILATGADVGANNLMLYLADKDWAAAHPDTVAQFLAAASKEVTAYSEERPDDSLTAFYKDYIKMPIDKDTLDMEIESHRLFTVDEQLDFIQSGSCARSMEDIARFFMDINKLATSNYGRMVKNNFNIDDTYLKLAQDKYMN